MTESSSLDRVIVPSTNLTDAIKCVLVSFDSTICSNLSAGMPIEGIEVEINQAIVVGRAAGGLNCARRSSTRCESH